MRLSIADDLWATHPDVEWNPPHDLPPLDEIRDAELHFRQQLQPVSRETAARVLQALVACFQAKWEGPEAKAQLDVWLIVLGDVPGDLWTESATLLMRNHTFGMPKPSHLLAIVKLQFEQRKVNAERVKRLLEKAGQKPEPKPVEREPVEVRLRASVWRGWHSRENEPSFLTPVLWRSACDSERQLARLEEREPATWSVEGTPTAPPPKLAVPLGWTRPPHFPPVKVPESTLAVGGVVHPDPEQSKSGHGYAHGNSSHGYPPARREVLAETIDESAWPGDLDDYAAALAEDVDDDPFARDAL